MNRQKGGSSLAMVLLLLMLGCMLLAGLNQRLETFSTLVSREYSAIQNQAAAQSALEWGQRQPWSLQPEVQCKFSPRQQRVCLRRLAEQRVILSAGNHEQQVWRGGAIVQGDVRFSPHGWSDFCPLKERALCQMP